MIARRQRATVTKAEKQKYGLKQAPDGVLTTTVDIKREGVEKEKIFIPNSAKKLLKVAVVANHQGAAGHAGTATSIKMLKQNFTAANIRAKATAIINTCMQCIMCRGGMEPKPFGATLMGEHPLEVIYMDFMWIGDLYFLVVICSLTNFTWFFPCTSPSAANAAKGLAGVVLYGVPSWIISDGGGHFTSEVLAKLTNILGAWPRNTSAMRSARTKPRRRRRTDCTRPARQHTRSSTRTRNSAARK